MCSNLLFVLLICKLIVAIPTSDSNSLVVSSTESAKENEGTEGATGSLVNPNIYAMHIQANISNRFATTLVTSKVRNMKNVSAETTFSIILPENAFISQFEMEIKGKIYKAYVKEKEEAKKIYEQAVSQGQSAAHVELSARDSKTFTVSVNIEPESKTIFRLIYEELLQRQIGHYELVVNIHPGQIVDDLNVRVYINESRPLTLVKTPFLRTGNEIGKNDDKLNPSADIELINATSAVVSFNPNVKQQKEFAQHLGADKENGLAGQFIVQYDVERDPQGGEVLVRDGYFVHFFSPSELKPLKKHVVFVLDHSGSMYGRKIEQLTDAMKNILSQLAPTDLFNIVRFNDNALVWNISQNSFAKVNLEAPSYGNLEPQLKALNLPEAVAGTEDHIQKAKEAIENFEDMSLTNIIEGLEVGLFLIKRTQKQFPKQYQPMIIFLTDGLPNAGMHSGDEISKKVSKLNSGENRASIFSLSFGSSADKNFLRKLSSKNLGFSRHIFEAADSSLQLEDFYRRISSPLLSNITFKYVDGVTDITKSNYPILFNGSELVVAGKAEGNSNVLSHVTALCPTGIVEFKAVRTEPITSLERLWAFLTVQQILKERKSATNKTELTKKALDLSLKYSFVTEVSSLVVVKPNKTDSIESKNVDDSRLEGRNNARTSNIGSHGSRGGLSGPGYRRFGQSMPIQPLSGSSYPSFSQSAFGPPGPPSLFQPASGQIGLQGRARLYRPSYHQSQIQSQVRARLYRPSYHQRPYYNPYQQNTTPRYRSRNYYPGSTRRPTPTMQQKHNVPLWLENMKKNNESITTSQGTFKIGNKGDVITQPSCSNTPQNTTGVCTIILDCPELFATLTDVNIYLKYFCPLNEYAGVCCPRKTVVLGTP